MALSKQQRLAVAVAHVDFDDCDSFWAALTTEQAAALLRVAPRIVGPWQKAGLSQWVRTAVVSDYTAAVVGDYGDICDWDLGTEEPGTFGATGSLDEAKAAADAALVANNWRLLCTLT